MSDDGFAPANWIAAAMLRELISRASLLTCGYRLNEILIAVRVRATRVCTTRFIAYSVLLSVLTWGFLDTVRRETVYAKLAEFVRTPDA